MDESAIATKIGEFTQAMKGFEREMKEVKDALKEGNRNCQGCKAGIDAQILDLKLHGATISQENAADIVLIKSRLDKLEKRDVAEVAIEKSNDKTADHRARDVGVIVAVLMVAIELVRWKLTGGL